MAEKEDKRPLAAIGHIAFAVSDVKSHREFYERLGMRLLLTKPEFSSLELRGGTHLCLFPGGKKAEDGAKRDFDLIVEDVEAFREGLQKGNMQPGEISYHDVSGHYSFAVKDPDGFDVVISSTHAEGPI